MAAITLAPVSRVSPTGYHAVRDLTLEITDGELLVIVGPSGSGKSTALRLIAGLEVPTAGQIRIGGGDVTGMAPQDRNLAMVFQSYALYPHKSVRENLAFGLRARHVDPARIDERVATVATLLGIDALLDRKPAQLSGGQRQRVALGRAIVREPRAFLLDEPLSNLDPLLRVTMRAELALLHRRLGTTMVHVTHDQEEAMMLGTRIAVMREGRLEQVGAPLEIFRQPANTFVAGFVGSPAMNLWPCSWSVAYDRARATCPAFSIAFGPHDLAVLDSAAITVGIRPHDVVLTEPSQGDARGAIEVVEPLGTVTLIHIRVDGLAGELVRVLVPADAPVAVDDRVGLGLDRDRLYFFDGRTGERLERHYDS